MPAWAANDPVDVYCIIDDYPPEWLKTPTQPGMNHEQRIRWTIDKSRIIVARHPNHRPVITAINGSPDTGRSIAPDVLEAWKKEGSPQ